MLSQPARQPDPGPAGILPTLSLFLLAVFTVLPWHVPSYATVVPLYPLMPVYYWTIYRPDLLSPPIIFLGGIVLDLLTGAPPGGSSLMLLLTRTIIYFQRRFFVDRLFPFLWLGFTLLAGFAVAFDWLLGGIIGGALLDARAAALQWVLTVACFPVVGYVLMQVQRHFLVPG
jgi:rod shape-determining protein MreD